MPEFYLPEFACFTGTQGEFTCFTGKTVLTRQAVFVVQNISNMLYVLAALKLLVYAALSY
jgi:hypothetical protein